MFVVAMVIFSVITYAQKNIIVTVTDVHQTPLPGVLCGVGDDPVSWQTTADGTFSINIPAHAPSLKLTFRLLGYESLKTAVNPPYSDRYSFSLTEAPYLLEGLDIHATRAGERTPMTFTDMNKPEIQRQNTGQDLPYLLEGIPSAVITSDAGAGIGYTGIRIRGSDPTRINVNINGVPLNEAESQSVYWVDLPDIAASADQIQVQRGVGASTNGAGAFGGTINVSTTDVSSSPYARIDLNGGSFGSLRSSVQVSTGLMNGWYAEGRYSDIRSDGYIDRATSRLNSYHLQTGYQNERFKIGLSILSGHEVTYQAWGWVPYQYAITSGDLRRYNPQGEKPDGTFYDNQVDDYKQTHYQLNTAFRLSARWRANITAHYTRGYGYYEEYKADQSLQRYALSPVTVGDTSITGADIVRRLWLDNHFYGLVYSFDYTPSVKTSVTIGGGLNNYLGKHHGDVIWTQYTGDNSLPKRYYENEGNKWDFNIFARLNHKLGEHWIAYADLQYRYVSHSFEGYNRDSVDITQSNKLHFFNPKLGLTRLMNDGSQAYASVAVGNREPNRDDFTNAVASGIKPEAETLYDLEIGWKKRSSIWYYSANLFGMYYVNQLAQTGALNDVGEGIRINIPKSYRAGIELDAAYKGIRRLTLSANASLSRNKVIEFNEKVDDWDNGGQITVNHKNTDLVLSPAVVLFGRAEYNLIERVNNQLSLALTGKYVGKQYLDNTQNENAALDPYFTLDGALYYGIKVKNNDLKLSLRVNNLLNKLYASGGWVYRYRYTSDDPTAWDIYSRKESNGYYNQSGLMNQAGTYFMAGISLVLK